MLWGQLLFEVPQLSPFYRRLRLTSTLPASTNFTSCYVREYPHKRVIAALYRLFTFAYVRYYLLTSANRLGQLKGHVHAYLSSCPMPLTETAIRALKPSDKIRKVFDERGLYLEVSPSGGKWWRFKYRFAGTEKRLSLGTYPDTSLKMAREKRDDMRTMLAQKIDPGIARKAEKASGSANTFSAVAREFIMKHGATLSEDYVSLSLRRCELYLFPYLGSVPLESITAPMLLNALRRTESRAVETAHRLLQMCGQIFRYGIATGRCERDIAADLRGALQPVVNKHHAAVTEPKDLRTLLLAIDGYQGGIVVQVALKLAPLVFVRPGELRQAQWKDVDFKKREWRFIVSKTKQPHIVPLSKQSIKLLKELHPLTGHSTYVFPSPRSSKRPMSENAVLAALRSLGLTKEQVTGHGFRATARTLLDEVLKYPPHLIEHQLAHSVRDPLGRAYNRTQHLEERHKMMQRWATYLDELRKQ